MKACFISALLLLFFGGSGGFAPAADPPVDDMLAPPSFTAGVEVNVVNVDVRWEARQKPRLTTLRRRS